MHSTKHNGLNLLKPLILVSALLSLNTQAEFYTFKVSDLNSGGHSLIRSEHYALNGQQHILSQSVLTDQAGSPFVISYMTPINSEEINDDASVTDAVDGGWFYEKIGQVIYGLSTAAETFRNRYRNQELFKNMTGLSYDKESHQHNADKNKPYSLLSHQLLKSLATSPPPSYEQISLMLPFGSFVTGQIISNGIMNIVSVVQDSENRNVFIIRGIIQADNLPESDTKCTEQLHVESYAEITPDNQLKNLSVHTTREDQQTLFNFSIDMVTAKNDSHSKRATQAVAPSPAEALNNVNAGSHQKPATSTNHWLYELMNAF